MTLLTLSTSEAVKLNFNCEINTNYKLLQTHNTIEKEKINQHYVILMRETKLYIFSILISKIKVSQI